LWRGCDGADPPLRAGTGAATCSYFLVLLRRVLEERDREELRLLLEDALERDELLRAPLRLAPLEEDRRAGAFRVVVPPLERDELRAGALSGGGGATAGALADAAFVRPPATASSGSIPSSRSAITAPTVMAIAAPSPRKIPIFRVGEPASILQRIRPTARAPRPAVTPPRGTGTLTR
jgi:hypothetical protein